MARDRPRAESRAFAIRPEHRVTDASLLAFSVSCGFAAIAMTPFGDREAQQASCGGATAPGAPQGKLHGRFKLGQRY